MFKGIIPGKRLASVDLVAERNSDSKENADCSSAPSKSARKPSVFQDVNGNKMQVNGAAKSKHPSATSDEMLHAFDKLLVSLH